MTNEQITVLDKDFRIFTAVALTSIFIMAVTVALVMPANLWVPFAVFFTVSSAVVILSRLGLRRVHSIEVN